jgi:hypothetical protein
MLQETPVEFKPTWLYVKRCAHCGLLYFGKTTSNPTRYSGSGTYWLRHLEKHAASPVHVWDKRIDDYDTCVFYALLISTANDIVKSRRWANQKVETGLDGGYTPQYGEKNHRFGKSYYTTTDGSREFCLAPNDKRIKTLGLVKGRKTSVSVASSSKNLGNTNSAGKIWSVESRERNSISNKRFGHAEFLGRSHTAASKALMRKHNVPTALGRRWFNDGQTEIMLYPDSDEARCLSPGRLPFSEETRLKIGIASKSRPPASARTRMLRSINASLRVVSDDTKRKLSESKLGEKNPQYGKSWVTYKGRRVYKDMKYAPNRSQKSDDVGKRSSVRRSR